MKVCFVGDDVHPPWNHASSILTKRLIECLAGSAECQLATIGLPDLEHDYFPGVEKITVTGAPDEQAQNSARLALAVRNSSADIIHLVGTNAMVFSPLCKLFNGRKRLVRHIFTSYDDRDRAIRPVRRLVSNFFIDAYAFTMPWTGDWAHDIPAKTRSFLVRPPIDCDLYRPSQKLKEAKSESSFMILYMGPLFRSRFPMESVLDGLRLLLKAGVEARLVVLTSALRTSRVQTDSLVSTARQLGIDRNVVVRREDLDEKQRVSAYNDADVVIFPFVGPVPEKLADPPFGVLEAMACGAVVAGSRVLSIPEVVKHGVTGFLFDNVTSQEICRILTQVLVDSDLKETRRRARSWIMDKFSYPRIRRELLDAYDSLMSSSTAWA